MALHKAKRGLDLPLAGSPKQEIAEHKNITRVAVLADDFPGMKPRFVAREGDIVARGDVLFSDRKVEGVLHTAPAAGKITKIHRGTRRVLRSVEIELSEGELNGSPEYAQFENYEAGNLEPAKVRALLIESGSWTSLRTRPFGHTPEIDSSPAALFVNGMDSGPHAPEVELIVSENQEAFDTGLKALSTLTEGPTFLCVKEGSSVPEALTAKVKVEHFDGPHPSGTPGFHIHTLMPAHRARVVWTVTYHEVIAIGDLFMTGHLSSERVVAITGPAAKEPRLVRTRSGASLKELMHQELNTETEVRIISGDVLSGMAANGEAFEFLGKRAAQVSAVREAGERKFLGWLGWGENLFSVIPTFVSSIMGKKSFDLTTDTNGSPRAMVPIGMYERVTAFDVIPTHLLRALLVGDIEMAEKLGALELDEEDVALYSFVCPGKTNYGNILRANLERMFAEG